MCEGFTFLGLSMAKSIYGSSPRAWGLLRATMKKPGKLRFIPTCVGFTNGCGRRSFLSPVHPHMRGVYGQGGGVGAKTGRFIPTCVGFTLSWAKIFYPTTVHPHMRGVYGFIYFSLSSSSGSSPHAWGLRSSKFLSCVFLRFIPTCVGFTSMIFPGKMLVAGSSPHAWGLLRMEVI